MKFSTLSSWLLACFLFTAYIGCAGKQVATRPSNSKALVESRKPSKSDRSSREEDSYNSHLKLRAAKVLQKVRFKGDYETNHSYIEFNSESNFIYIKFDGDYRQGKITNLGKSGPDAREGEYWIQTWKPQNYIGFKTGPSRKYFKSFLLKWKVKTAAGPDFKGRILHLRVFTHKRVPSTDGSLKEIHKFELREQKRGY